MKHAEYPLYSPCTPRCFNTLKMDTFFVLSCIVTFITSTGFITVDYSILFRTWYSSQRSPNVHTWTAPAPAADNTSAFFDSGCECRWRRKSRVANEMALSGPVPQSWGISPLYNAVGPSLRTIWQKTCGMLIEAFPRTFWHLVFTTSSGKTGNTRAHTHTHTQMKC